MVRSAISSAATVQDALQMQGNLGEVLRAKGDLEEAVVVLRGVIHHVEGILKRQVKKGTMVTRSR